MNKTCKLSILFLLLVGFWSGSVSGKYRGEIVKATKGFDPAVMKAWGQAGALIGWLAVSEHGQWRYLEGKPDGVDSLPVFLWQEYKPGVIARLPAPSVPFAIGLGGTKMDNSGLKELASLQYLRSLDLSHTRVTDSGLGQLAAIKALRNLDLGASLVTDRGLKELARVKSLHKLYFGSTAVADAGVKALIDLEDLQVLYLYNTKVTDACLPALADFKSLRSLLLTKTGVTDEGVDALIEARPELVIMR
ncbi:hypothetical protein MNBD_GAMMA21-2496 [hydrothermal vent metagenome]|uniref:Alanyl-tRNA synthetase n=1 Tax=hydrothermal vent metagenome TaxID=652676 RepID=A0A3B1AEJ7_9ZZZZ